MNRFIMIAFISILIAPLGGLGLHVGNEPIRLHRTSLAIKEVFAAEKGYKAGMIN
ncbi:MAG: hypothetical protein JRJ33_08095, partial [Deltaproteobacteria bacterium]|nr:hypothetical protein [Deltaproteobacteria bacterium]